MNVSRGHLSDYWGEDLNRAAVEKRPSDEEHDCFACLMDLFKGEVGYDEGSVGRGSVDLVSLMSGQTLSLRLFLWSELSRNGGHRQCHRKG